MSGARERQNEMRRKAEVAFRVCHICGKETIRVETKALRHYKYEAQLCSDCQRGINNTICAALCEPEELRSNKAKAEADAYARQSNRPPFATYRHFKNAKKWDEYKNADKGMRVFAPDGQRVFIVPSEYVNEESALVIFANGDEKEFKLSELNNLKVKASHVPPDYFSKHEPSPAFKVGDRVVGSERSNPYYLKGRPGTIVEKKQYYFHVHFDYENKNAEPWPMRSVELALLPSPQESPLPVGTPIKVTNHGEAVIEKITDHGHPFDRGYCYIARFPNGSVIDVHESALRVLSDNKPTPPIPIGSSVRVDGYGECKIEFAWREQSLTTGEISVYYGIRDSDGLGHTVISRAVHPFSPDLQPGDTVECIDTVHRKLPPQYISQIGKIDWIYKGKTEQGNEYRRYWVAFGKDGNVILPATGEELRKVAS